jgi:hypothetical protein
MQVTGAGCARYKSGERFESESALKGSAETGLVAPQTAGAGNCQSAAWIGVCDQSRRPAICGRIRISYFLVSRHSLIALVRASPVSFLLSAAFSHAFWE